MELSEGKEIGEVAPRLLSEYQILLQEMRERGVLKDSLEWGKYFCCLLPRSSLKANGSISI